MHIAHSIFIALSAFTAWLGAWTTLDLFSRVRAHAGGWRSAWLAATAVAMGLSIWSMHFIAMLGFDPGAEVRYDVTLTVLSLLLAIATTAFAFVFARSGGLRREVAGGVVMGAGICTMHYVGMAALVTPVQLANEPVFVALAFVVAVTASIGALLVARRDTTVLQRMLAAAVLASAIVGMHYTAMAGVRIGQVVGQGGVDSGIDPLLLAIAVATGTLVILLLALIAAVSDRRYEALAVREASRTEAQLRTILDNLPIGVFVAASPSGEIRFANREAQKMLGRSLDGVAIWSARIAESVIDSSGAPLKPEDHVLYQAMHENRRVGPALRTFRRGDGQLVHVEVTAAPIPPWPGSGPLAVGAFQDVTAKLAAEEAARRELAAAQAQKAETEAALAHAQRLEALGRLTGGVAHDFNNLLTVIIGALDVIQRNPENGNRRTRLADAALTAARRGERLTAQLLAFARHQPLQPEVRDLNELITECEPLLRRAAGDALSLRVQLSASSLVARIDPAQFEAALLNRIVNAVDASPHGGEIMLRTEVCTLSENAPSKLPRADYACITVSDRGVGMSAEVVSRIFEPFYTTKAQGKGTGLGLSQVYGFVKQSGGDVAVASATGEGASFRIYLPLSQQPAVHTVVNDAEAARGRKALAILLVEDDPSVAAVTEAMLSDLGHRVRRASDALEALEFLRSDVHVDVLFSDVMMPGGMNGAELALHARELRPQLKILLTSGYAGDELEAVLARGSQPFIRKPYLASELAEALEELVPEDEAERRQAGSFTRS
jgi:PAS domain S-box-containing protein